LTNLVALYSGMIAILAIIFAPLIVTCIAPGLKTPMRHQTEFLLRIMLPSLCFASIASSLASRYQARESFLLPATMAFTIQATNLLLVLMFRSAGVSMAAGAYSIGSLLALIVLLVPLLMRNEHRMVMRLQDPAVRGALRAMGIILAVSALYAAYPVIERRIASQISLVAVSYVGYSSKLAAMLTALISAGTAITVLPRFSACVSKEGKGDLPRTATAAINTMTAISLPSLVIVGILREPIIRVLFERGTFDHSATLAVANALLLYLPSIFGFCLAAIPGSLLYACRETKSMAIIGIAVFAAYLIYCPWLGSRYGYLGIACGTSLFALTTALAQLAAAVVLRRAIDMAALTRTSVKVILGTGIAGCIVFIIAGRSPGLGRAATAGLVGLFSFAILSFRVFKVPEIKYLCTSISSIVRGLVHLPLGNGKTM
jgi:putative peptidoglycan lipid II flippase